MAVAEVWFNVVIETLVVVVAVVVVVDNGEVVDEFAEFNRKPDC